MKEEKKKRQQELAEARARMKELEEKEKAERDAYRQVVNETVEEVFPLLKTLHEKLIEVKNLVFDNFDHALDLKAEIFGISNTQQSHTFSNESGDKSITIGYRVKESYDDTVDAGIEKVNAYLRGLAKDAETENLIETIMSLLSKDKQGNLNASRVIELEKIAIRSKDDLFLDGIRIIKEAYKPVRTCRFIDVKFKDDNGKWQPLPLAISAVD